MEINCEDFFSALPYFVNTIVVVSQIYTTGQSWDLENVVSYFAPLK